MKEIKLDQIWSEGRHEGIVVNVFGARIVIRPKEANAEENVAEKEVREDEFRPSKRGRRP